MLKDLHGVLFQPTAAELVVPAEVKVMAWKKEDRNGVVVRGAGGPHSGANPGGGTVRIGGRVPWDAEVQYAYRAGYDSRGQLSVTHLVDERGYGAMLNKTQRKASSRDSGPFRMRGGRRCTLQVLSQLPVPPLKRPCASTTTSRLSSPADGWPCSRWGNRRSLSPPYPDASPTPYAIR